MTTIAVISDGGHLRSCLIDVSTKLADERVDVVRWSEDPAETVAELTPPGSEALAVDDSSVVIVESAKPPTPLQLNLAAQMVGRPVNRGRVRRC